MRLKKNIFLLLFFAINLSPLYSQILREGDVVPQGAVIYSLPQTSVKVVVTIEQELFTPGIYAQYAQKYLGQKATTSQQKKSIVKQITVEQIVEADNSFAVAANIGTSKNASANFLNFTSQGLIISPGAFDSKSVVMQISSLANGNSLSERISNTVAEQFGPKGNIERVVYSDETDEDGQTERVAKKVIESFERTPEQRAAETAELIFSLRKKKIAILTGDTDANYEGGAMGAAIEELNKLDDQYNALFFGTISKRNQTLSFIVTPKASNSSQRYTICKISDNEGILPAGSSDGRDLVLQFDTSSAKIYNGPTEENLVMSKGKIVYRLPLSLNATILESNKVLAQTRVVVYQFGKMIYFPLELSAGK